MTARPMIHSVATIRTFGSTMIHRKQRINLALALIAAAFVLNVAVLVTDDTSPGWQFATVILLASAGISLLAERRER